MREIKFRAWDGALLKYWYGWDPAVIQAVVYSHKRYYAEQFTGMHDANGVEIYEGDILEYVSEGIVSVVEWWNNSWSENIDKPYNRIVYNRIVIGNIHENPELLR